jgi:hypothetical protein
VSNRVLTRNTTVPNSVTLTAIAAATGTETGTVMPISVLVASGSKSVMMLATIVFVAPTNSN